MKITLNGKSRELQSTLPLTELIQQINANNQRVIAEVNGEIVKKDHWANITINDGDEIELVTFVGGG